MNETIFPMIPFAYGGPGFYKWMMAILGGTSRQILECHGERWIPVGFLSFMRGENFVSYAFETNQ